MNLARPVPGSFRDPAGGVHRLGDRILRSVTAEHEADFDAALRSGVLDRLAAEARIVAFEPLSLPPEALGLAGVSQVLEHPRLPFISHPYEWSFEALRAAALLHLDVHLAAMDGRLTLSDASAYNVQFIGTRPIFIDILSFRPYREGEIWAGYRKFCQQFLNGQRPCLEGRSAARELPPHVAGPAEVARRPRSKALPQSMVRLYDDVQLFERGAGR
jgi:hypothetical protein